MYTSEYENTKEIQVLYLKFLEILRDNLSSQYKKRIEFQTQRKQT